MHPRLVDFIGGPHVAARRDLARQMPANHPHRANGKGSTAAMLRAMLKPGSRCLSFAAFNPVSRAYPAGRGADFGSAFGRYFGPRRGSQSGRTDYL